MNPLFFHAINLTLRPKQRCPRCQYEQPTSTTEHTSCISCAALIPPLVPR